MLDLQTQRRYTSSIGREDRALLGSNSSACSGAVKQLGGLTFLPGSKEKLYGQKAKNPGGWGRAPKKRNLFRIFDLNQYRCIICEDRRDQLLCR